MPSKSDLLDQNIITCLQAAYGLEIAQLNFLPLGADQHAAVYRIVSCSKAVYFLKLRSGPFNKISLTLPKYLSEQGIPQVTPPLTTITGALYAALDAFTLILYPFIQGKDATESRLSDTQWVEFGRVLKNIHTVHLPPALERTIPKETFTPWWRENVRIILQQVEIQTYQDPLAAKLKTFLTDNHSEILDLILLTDRFATAVEGLQAEFVPCHADLHAANLLVGEDGSLHILDWDNPVLALKERDLMFIGAGICGVWDKASEGTLFYQGYGTDADPTCMAYYRNDRIIEDIALFSEHVLEGSGSLEDQERSLHYLQSNFDSGGTIDLALKTTYAQNK